LDKIIHRKYLEKFKLLIFFNVANADIVDYTTLGYRFEFC